MSNYILINNIEVQGANAISGFTWGFPAITHFLGFAHNLSRKLNNKEEFKNIKLGGCMVIAHSHQVHTYQGYGTNFTQSRNPPYLNSHNKKETPPIIEEGKMNMTVSLLIEYSGNIGNKEDSFLKWFENACYMQRLAGGTILNIKQVQLFTINNKTIHQIKRLLLPGFILQDRSDYLEEHYKEQQKNNVNTELLNSWLDFIALKQKARPEFNLIDNYIKKLEDKNLLEVWLKHLEKPYSKDNIPQEIINYNTRDKDNKLAKQWQEYCKPNDKTNAVWEYLPKPKPGYLVPIMIGYKAISKLYPNKEVENTRDSETDVCFVESVHTIGEWIGVHKFTENDIKQSIWNYAYEKDWYLCKQEIKSLDKAFNKELDDDSF
jgi:CRISPR-associated protein Csy2